MKSPPRRWPQIALVALGFLIIGVFVGGHTSWMPSWVRSTFTDQSASQRQIQNVLGLIEKDYYRPFSAATLANNGLKAAVADL